MVMAVAVANSKTIFLSHRQNPFSKTLLQEFSEPCSCEFSLPAYVQKGATPGYAQVIAEWLLNGIVGIFISLKAPI